MNLERIATLLASGLPPASVASIVGLSAGRISQIMKEPSFELLLAGKQAEMSARDIEEISLSARYLEVEHKLVQQIGEMVVGSEMRDLVGALRVVSERQDRMRASKAPAPVGGNVINTYVQVNLPSHIADKLEHVQLSSQKEIIAIGDRTLSPLPSQQVIGLFAGMDITQTITADKEDYHVTSTTSDSAESSTQEAFSFPLATEVQQGIEAKAEGQVHALNFYSVEQTQQLASGAASFLSRLRNKEYANAV